MSQCRTRSQPARCVVSTGIPRTSQTANWTPCSPRSAVSDWTPPHYKSKASPGPWKWVPFKNWDGGLQASDGTWVISNDETDNTPENRHDATLIRLAPDMASMLRELEWAD